MASDSLWGERGPHVSWRFNPAITQIGCRVDLVVELGSIDHVTGAGLVFMWPCKARARFFNGLQHVGEQVESVTVLGAIFSDNVGMPGFTLDQQSEIMSHPRISYADMFNLVELCAGIGIGTQGFAELGFKTVVAIELRKPSAEAYKQLHPEVEVICGDIRDKSVVGEVYRRHPRSTAIMAGFSCQPFSGGGAQQGVADSRADVLLGVMNAAFLLRCPLLVLECVKNAGSNRYVRNVVESFRDEMGFHLSEGLLSLESCWVSRRDRWWAILAAPCLGPINIPQLPSLVFPSKLRHIIPKPFPCSDRELEELVLSEADMRVLVSIKPDFGSMYLPLNGKCPTCLHSWGNQFGPCPCGCRLAFSASTLRDRGIYGVFVPTGQTIVVDGVIHPELRHPHPSEVGWANGVLMPSSWPEPLKLSLAGLGQQASPIHCLWVAAQIVHHIDKLHFGASQTSGSQHLDQFIQKLFKQIQDVTGTLGHVCSVLPVGGSASVELIPPDAPLPVTSLADRMPWHVFSHCSDGSSVTLVDAESRSSVVVLLADRRTTLKQLLEAERALTPERKSYQVVDCQTSLAVEETEEIAARCLWFELVVTPFPLAQPVRVSESAVEVPVISPTLPWTSTAGGEQIQPVSDAHQGGLVEDLQGCAGAEDPLTQLKDRQLVGVLPPKIDTLRGMVALLGSPIAAEDRLLVLENQNGTWADDEVSWHVNRMLLESGRKDWAFIPPVLAAEGLKRNCVQLIAKWIETLPVVPTILLGAVPCGGHWIPFMWTWTAESLTAYSWDVAGNTPRCLNLLHDAVTKAVGARTFICNISHRNFSTSDYCGLCSVRWLDHKIRGRMLPTCVDEVHYLHELARRQFVDFVRTQSTLQRPWIWASGLDQKSSNRLKELLIQHGVPETQLDTRLSLLVQSLGIVPLQDALTSANPWRLLKQLANSHRPPLQIILPEELAEIVKTKAEAGTVKSRKKSGKGTGKGPPGKPACLDPSKLCIDVDSFVTADDKPLPQIDAKLIGPLAEGVFLSSPSLLDAHLRAGQPLSKAALAAVLLNVDSANFATDLPWSQIRLVLRCRLNQEPLLLNAYLVQLGQIAVCQAKMESTVAVPLRSAACLKVAVYRDSVEIPWQDFVQAPIRYVLSVLQPLLVCTTCGSSPHEHCVRWHVLNDDDPPEPVLDLWRRQWTSLTFKPCEPHLAAIFWVNIRYLSSIQEAVLRCSGCQGVFVEPRSLDGKLGTMDFQVIWLPKENLAELQRLQQCHIKVLGLARLGSRLGLRVASSDAAEMTRSIKPGSVFLSSGDRQDYEAGPFPFGLDRLNLSKLCTAWKWQARPLHPVRSLEGGLGTVWLLQASQEPPEQVLTYQGGKIVINKVVKKAPQESSPSTVIGNSSTMALCQLESAAERPTDPWLKADPWQAALQHSSAPCGPFVGKHLQQIEERIEQKVLARVAPPGLDDDVDMDSGTSTSASVIAKFEELESQISRLANKHQALESKLDDSVQRSDAQVSQLQHQVAAQFEAQRGEMQGLFTSQMAQIEALLSKKARHE